jgi:hypothetical protein
MVQITTEKFIERAKNIHGDRYNYSKSEYVSAKDKLIIICSIHGEFEQTPNDHIYQKSGCRECAKLICKDSKRKTKDQFVIEANQVHNNKYDYSKTKYVNAHTKVVIICPEHGEFEKRPLDHIKGKQGCVKCNIDKGNYNPKKDTEKFIDDAVKIHGNKYDYSKTEYINSMSDVKIICKIHGEFKLKAHDHLYKQQGCQLCSFDSGKYNPKRDTNSFINEAQLIHGDKFDYSIVDYIQAHNTVNIICKKHGIFNTLANNHLKGSGCPKCGNETVSKKLRKTTMQFIKDAKKIHGNKYDYSYVNYIGSYEKIIIKCKKHGKFEQRAQDHLRGSGCTKCSMSGYSKKQILWLNYISKTNNIKIQHALNDGEYKIDKYKADGYCKETNTVYEFFGDFYHGNPHRYDKNKFNPICKKTMGELYEQTIQRNKHIISKGYNLITIWESEWDNIAYKLLQLNKIIDKFMIEQNRQKIIDKNREKYIKNIEKL